MLVKELGEAQMRHGAREVTLGAWKTMGDEAKEMLKEDSRMVERKERDPLITYNLYL